MFGKKMITYHPNGLFRFCCNQDQVTLFKLLFLSRPLLPYLKSL